MTVLNIFYCLLGAAFVVLGIACLIEKYRTVCGGIRLPARILACEKQRSARKSGGYCYKVEFNDGDGVRHEATTNDSLWFARKNAVNRVIEIWYNPAHPEIVERKSLESEILSAVLVALGLAAIFGLGFGG